MSRMKVALFAACFAAAACAFAPAQAQDVRAACKADREKFCAGITPGEGKFRACMDSHMAELSAECRTAREAAREAWKKVEASCKTDAGKFCADAGKERPALAKCLESHASELEPACAAAWKARPGANRA
jgi:hypothetical protein